MKDGLYPTTIEVINFKGIKHQVIDFGNGNIWLIGGNGAGKSSLIDALLVPYGAEHTPEMPIHAGEERGMIVYNLKGTRNGVEEEYRIQYSFTPSNRLGKLTLERNGEKITASEKTILRDILGTAAIPLDKFFNANVKDQVKEIKDATGCGDILDQLDQKRAELADKRKVVSSNLKDAKAVNSREARPFSDDDVEKYSKPIDEEPIQQELASVGKAMDEWQEKNNRIENHFRVLSEREAEYRKNTQEVTEIDLQIKALEERKQNLILENEGISKACEYLNKKIDNGNRWRNATPKPSAEEVAQKLAWAKEYNLKYELIQKYAKRQKEIMAMQDKFEELDKEVKDIDAKKMQVIAISQLPVDGLSFSENGITLDGIPIGQVNTQKKIDLVIAINKALNPTVKLIVIGEASLLDKNHLKATIARIEAAGYYWIAETVNPNGGPLEVIYQERTGDDTNSSN